MFFILLFLPNFDQISQGTFEKPSRELNAATILDMICACHNIHSFEGFKTYEQEKSCNSTWWPWRARVDFVASLNIN